MSDKERIKAAYKRYELASHAMQTGVAVEIDFNIQAGKKDAATSPKHLRVGINSAMVEHSAMVSLLMKKGIITELEYAETLAEAMEIEVERYENWIFNKTGKKVTLS